MGTVGAVTTGAGGVEGWVVLMMLLDVSGPLVVGTVGAPLTRNRSREGFSCEAVIAPTTSSITAATARTAVGIDRRW